MKRLALPIALLSASASLCLAETLAVNHELHITEGGGFLNKSLKEMGSKEFQALVTIGCAAFAVDCSQAAQAVRTAATVGTPILGRRGEAYFITGDVTEHRSDSEEWRGYFRAPPGYEVCKAGLDYGSMSITGPSTFNTRIVRDPQNNGLFFYAVVPKHRPTRQWIHAQMLVTYVKAGTVAQNQCAPTGSNPWVCKGQNCTVLTRINDLR